MIRKVALYTLAFLLLIYSIHWFISEGLRRNRAGVYEKYTTLFLKSNHYNTLVLGSSRAEMHLDVGLLDSLTGLRSYNAGVSGATTRVAFTVLKAYTLHSEAPENVFFECDFHISHLKTDTIFNFPRYFPYLSNARLYEGFRQIDPRFALFRYLPLYSLPYSGINALGPALNGWAGRRGSYDKAYERGFFRNTVNDGYDHFNSNQHLGYMHPETRQYLDSIIGFCQQHHCRLFLTMSPAYSATQQELLNRDEVIGQYQDIADFYHLPLLNYSTDSSICRHQAYFEDNYHLFYTGARLYTRKIAGDFNNIIR